MFWRSLSVGTAFLLNILFARYFAATVSGQIFYLFTVFAFVIQVISLSFESGVAYYAAINEIPGSQLLGFSLAWSFLSSAAALILFRPAAGLFSLRIDYPLSYAAAYILGNLLISFGNAFCYSRYRFMLPGAIAVIVNALLITLLIIMTSTGDQQYFISLYFYSFLIHGVALFVSALISFRFIPALNMSFARLRLVFRYSVRAFAGNLLFLLLNRVDFFFVKRFCTSEQLGNYIQVSKIAQLFFILPSMIASVLFPAVAGGVKNNPRRVQVIAAVIVIVYGFVLTVPVISGHWLFPWLYGASFGQMYIPFLLLTPGILSISSLYPYTSYYAGINRPEVNMAAALPALLFIIIADLVFIPPFGINAAALISSLGYMIFQGYVLVRFSRDTSLPLQKSFTLDRREYLHIVKSVISKWGTTST